MIVPVHLSSVNPTNGHRGDKERLWTKGPARGDQDLASPRGSRRRHLVTAGRGDPIVADPGPTIALEGDGPSPASSRRSSEERPTPARRAVALIICHYHLNSITSNELMRPRLAVAPPERRRDVEHPRTRPKLRTRSSRSRLSRLAIGITGAFAILVIRLVFVQVFDASGYAAYARSEVDQRVVLRGSRGAIYARGGQLLALSVPSVDVIADDFLVSGAGHVADELAPLLGVPAARLGVELAEKNGYVVLARQVGSGLESAIANLAVDGITFQSDPRREYPGGTAFEPLLGGVNAAGQGDAGIEYADEALLSARSGSEILPESPVGPLPGSPMDVVPAKQGDDLVLSLDEPLQVEATDAVAAEMRASHADSGIAVIEDVHTGAILAMVDLVAAAGGAIVPADQNLAVTAMYEPGSVMKLATFSFALQDHLITPLSTLQVPYSLQIGGYTFADAEYHPTQTMSASQILAQSSNIGTIEISRLLGPERLSRALHALGFGAPTGLGWPGETEGFVGTPAEWEASPSSLGSVPIGTGVAVTPLQILDAYNAVANGGVMVAPYLVAGTVGPSGHERPVVHPLARRVLDTATAREIIPMLQLVVQDGTAVCAQVPGYVVAGKTGTAQVPETTGAGYVPGDFNATFVGIVPAAAPQLSGIVVLNHPNPIYGGSVAAPVFASISGTRSPTSRSPRRADRRRRRRRWRARATVSERVVDARPAEKAPRWYTRYGERATRLLRSLGRRCEPQSSSATDERRRESIEPETDMDETRAGEREPVRQAVISRCGSRNGARSTCAPERSAGSPSSQHAPVALPVNCGFLDGQVVFRTQRRPRSSAPSPLR
jgi:cell division protein FtsI (penicillin-binding protein 3)